MNDREKRNAYMREYLNALKARRYKWAIEALGGKCVRCGSADGPFEFDHIDPSTKTKIIALMWRFSEEKLLDELRKCQLLCSTCHHKKTCEDNGWQYSKGIHGLPSSHKHCSCDVCLAAWREYQRARRNATGMPTKKSKEQKIVNIIHGTRAGYQAERRHGIEHCEACRIANNEASKRLRQNPTDL